MNNQIIQFIAQQAGNALTKVIQNKTHASPTPATRVETLEQALERIYPTGKIEPKEAEAISKDITQAIISTTGDSIATACIPCSLGHFSTSVGLLNEAIRFKKDGLASNEILDRIAQILQEQNSLERVDLAPEKIQNSPEWERDLAEEALTKSRSLRHKLEGITNINELEEAAADTSRYYHYLNREWFKRRLSKLSSEVKGGIKEITHELVDKEIDEKLQTLQPERNTDT